MRVRRRGGKSHHPHGRLDDFPFGPASPRRGGKNTFRLLGVIRRYAAFALAPFAAALAIDVFLATERVAGRLAGFAGRRSGPPPASSGTVMPIGSGTGGRMGREAGQGPEETTEPTSLGKKIEQMLTETRVVLPGAQALLGFQLIIVFSEPFEKLAPAARGVHLAALGCVALAAIWLMTPAACHRIAFDGEDSEDFHRLGTRFLLAATGALALGIAADLGVVVQVRIRRRPVWRREGVGGRATGALLLSFGSAVAKLG